MGRKGWGSPVASEEQVLDLSGTSGWPQGPPTTESMLACCRNHGKHHCLPFVAPLPLPWPTVTFCDPPCPARASFLLGAQTSDWDHQAAKEESGFGVRQVGWGASSLSPQWGKMTLEK